MRLSETTLQESMVTDEALEPKKRREAPVIVARVSGLAYMDFEEKQGYTRIP